jgi:hypothetical protein
MAFEAAQAAEATRRRRRFGNARFTTPRVN